MNIQTLPESKSGHSLLLELGFAPGQICRWGVEKLFKECCEKWEDFCPSY